MAGWVSTADRQAGGRLPCPVSVRATPPQLRPRQSVARVTGVAGKAARLVTPSEVEDLDVAIRRGQGAGTLQLWVIILISKLWGEDEYDYDLCMVDVRAIRVRIKTIFCVASACLLSK